MINVMELFDEVRMFETKYPVSGWVPRVHGRRSVSPSLIIEAPDSWPVLDHENAQRKFVRDLMVAMPRAIEAAALIDKYDSSYVMWLVGKYGGGNEQTAEARRSQQAILRPSAAER